VPVQLSLLEGSPIMWTWRRSHCCDGRRSTTRELNGTKREVVKVRGIKPGCKGKSSTSTTRKKTGGGGIGGGEVDRQVLTEAVFYHFSVKVRQWKKDAALPFAGKEKKEGVRGAPPGFSHYCRPEGWCFIRKGLSHRGQT